MDPADPVNALCIQGMEAESRGDLDAARRLYAAAWKTQESPFQAAVAAHYVARHQPTPELALEWNQAALDQALAAPPAAAAALLPSLYLNVGKSHEDLGATDRARSRYVEAEAASHVLGDDPYGRMMREGIRSALERTRASEGA